MKVSRCSRRATARRENMTCTDSDPEDRGSTSQPVRGLYDNSLQYKKRSSSYHGKRFGKRREANRISARRCVHMAAPIKMMKVMSEVIVLKQGGAMHRANRNTVLLGTRFVTGSRWPAPRTAVRRFPPRSSARRTRRCRHRRPVRTRRPVRRGAGW